VKKVVSEQTVVINVVETSVGSYSNTDEGNEFSMGLEDVG
jgi:hypothetical protein